MRGLLGRWQTRTGTTFLVVCLSLVEGLYLGVRCMCVQFPLVEVEVEVCFLREIGVLGLGVVSWLDVLLLVTVTSLGGTIGALGLRWTTGHVFPLVVRVLLQ